MAECSHYCALCVAVVCCCLLCELSHRFTLEMAVLIALSLGMKYTPSHSLIDCSERHFNYHVQVCHDGRNSEMSHRGDTDVVCVVNSNAERCRESSRVYIFGLFVLL